MKKSEPLNPGENNLYINADKDHDIKGSIPKSDFFNGVEQELLNLIISSGQTPSEDKLTQVTEAIASMITKANAFVRYQSLYQRLKTVENGVIVAEDEKIIGWLAVSEATTITIDMSQVTKQLTDDVVTFELYINMPLPVAINWPANIMWPSGEVPDLSDGGLFLFTFRYIFSKSIWQASLNAQFTAV